MPGSGPATQLLDTLQIVDTQENVFFCGVNGTKCRSIKMVLGEWPMKVCEFYQIALSDLQLKEQIRG